jgi:hypothetical protein
VRHLRLVTLHAESDLHLSKEFALNQIQADLDAIDPPVWELIRALDEDVSDGEILAMWVRVRQAVPLMVKLAVSDHREASSWAMDLWMIRRYLDPDIVVPWNQLVYQTNVDGEDDYGDWRDYRKLKWLWDEAVAAGLAS